MRIDSHQHFWRYDPVRDSWITDAMTVLKRDFLPEQLIPQMKTARIDRCIAVQADQSERETHFLLQLAEENEEIAGIVGWVDLRAENVGDRLEHFSRFRKLRGFRHIVQAERDDRFMLREDFLRGIRALARHGFTYDILIYAQHLPVATQLVRKFPAQKFVVDHLAKPAIKDNGIEGWSRDIRELAMNPNVYCKVSGMVTEADWRFWTEADLKPYLDVVFSAFGTERLMFGSDWPVCLLAASYERVKDVVEKYMGELSSSEREKIFGLNVAQFYALDSSFRA